MASDKNDTKVFSILKEDYNMPSLFPQDWDNLLNKMLNDINGTLAAKLYR